MLSVLIKDPAKRDAEVQSKSEVMFRLIDNGTTCGQLELIVSLGYNK